ncbi:hypothetical protein E3N88_10149 [Mikania micrantha]|uniref:Uncharacterized protein n=1 Tax=Mikania micrantha TaxID=192012 RepID=A0A5N6PAV9_9ASTR|nr:hypothetical protein E3N88_10148 [Mikania micrantha]KAD6118878.1 hypothetical protein E3N88_10149 [Mikania micrantha]
MRGGRRKGAIRPSSFGQLALVRPWLSPLRPWLGLVISKMEYAIEGPCGRGLWVFKVRSRLEGDLNKRVEGIKSFV